RACVVEARIAHGDPIVEPIVAVQGGHLILGRVRVTLDPDRLAVPKGDRAAAGGYRGLPAPDCDVRVALLIDVEPVPSRRFEGYRRVWRVDLEDLVRVEPADLERCDAFGEGELLHVVRQVQGGKVGVCAEIHRVAARYLELALSVVGVHAI